MLLSIQCVTKNYTSINILFRGSTSQRNSENWCYTRISEIKLLSVLAQIYWLTKCTSYPASANECSHVILDS